MSSKLKPCHYLSALALGARYLTVCYRGDWEFIESWVPEKLKTGYAIHGLPSDPKMCAWKYLECKERLEEKKQSPCEEERPEEALSDHWDELVALPETGKNSVNLAFFYLQRMLPNIVKWDVQIFGNDHWEIFGGTCSLRYSEECFYLQSPHCESEVACTGIVDALILLYKNLALYQFEKI